MCHFLPAAVTLMQEALIVQRLVPLMHVSETGLKAAAGCSQRLLLCQGSNKQQGMMCSKGYSGAFPVSSSRPVGGSNLDDVLLSNSLAKLRLTAGTVGLTAAAQASPMQLGGLTSVQQLRCPRMAASRPRSWRQCQQLQEQPFVSCTLQQHTDRSFYSGHGPPPAAAAVLTSGCLAMDLGITSGSQ